jgi:hypothetical protein
MWLLNFRGQEVTIKLFDSGSIEEPTSILVFIKNFKGKRLVVAKEDINTFSAPYLG